MEEIKYDELVVFKEIQAIPSYIISFQSIEKEIGIKEQPIQEQIRKEEPALEEVNLLK